MHLKIKYFTIKFALLFLPPNVIKIDNNDYSDNDGNSNEKQTSSSGSQDDCQWDWGAG